MPDVLPPDPTFEDTPEVDLTHLRDPEELLLELDALNEASRVADHQGDPVQAEGLVREALLRRTSSRRPEDHLVLCAMNLIVGNTPTLEPSPYVVESQGWVDDLTEGLIGCWICWALGEKQEAIEGLQAIRDRQQTEEHGSSGAVNLLTLYFWTGALEALTRENVSQSKKMWRRAIEVASSHGTESSLLIQWAYAGTFFRSN